MALRLKRGATFLHARCNLLSRYIQRATVEIEIKNNSRDNFCDTVFHLSSVYVDCIINESEGTRFLSDTVPFNSNSKFIFIRHDQL